MFSVNQLTLRFGDRALFDEISFMANKNDRIGLVGKNGAGKSTLLKIISGLQKADTGAIAVPKGTRIGYLPQEMEHHLKETVKNETMSALKELNTMNARIEEIHHLLENGTGFSDEQYMELAEELSVLSERVEIMGGSQVEEKVEKVLFGLGFERSDFDRLLSEFSGGWQMRVELAKILIQEPEVLLLDEPTNHLDIESIQWLEDFLKEHNNAIVLISHDRRFLDNITNRTIEIYNGDIYDYRANYSKYVTLRQEEIERQKAEQKNQEKYIEQTERLIDKFRAKSSKASFAQSLIKKLDRLEKVEVDEWNQSSVRIKFPPAPHSGKVVSEGHDLTKRYDDVTIIDHIEFFIGKGEKIAIVGKNGAGKSTLSKIIAGVENYEGEFKLGHNVNIGYFPQEAADMLDKEKTVFETIDDAAVGEIRKQVRTILGSFLFGGDDIDKKVKVLSGGERTRLALCKLLLEPCNLLILDEPTNHLDLASKEILKKALINYDGTLILVSHDRDFIQGITNRIFEIRNHKLSIHHFDIDEYLKMRKEQDKAATSQKNNVAKSEKKEKPVAAVAPVSDKKKIENQIRKTEEQISKLEAEIQSLEEKIAGLDYSDKENTEKTLGLYHSKKSELEKFLYEWEKLQEEIS
jgi:ATP-binding cassette subfamily F protein 3